MTDPKIALQFSGGKDSLACLFLLKEQWPDMLVVWLNTGAAFTETLGQMRAISQLVPHFAEIRTDVIKDIEERGWPVDILPIRHSLPAQAFLGPVSPKLQGWTDCCARNIWFPMHQEMKKRGIVKVVRGQRLQEDYKSPILNGQVIDGIQYIFPLQGWTDSEVMSYLAEQRVKLPSYYSETGTSLDCWCCTAYLDAHKHVLSYMEKAHPPMAAEVRRRITIINNVSKPFMDLMKEGELLCPINPPNNAALSKASPPAPSKTKTSLKKKQRSSKSTPTPSPSKRNAPKGSSPKRPRSAGPRRRKPRAK